MPTLTTKLPPIPFGDSEDCVLLYLPNVDTYRVIVGTANKYTVLAPDAPYGMSHYSSFGCDIRNFDDSVSYTLNDGVWVPDGSNAGTAHIFYKIEDIPDALSDGAFCISSTFDLFMETVHTPYNSNGDKLLLNLHYIDLHHQQLTVMDSVLSGEQMTSPILLEVYGLLPVCIGLLVGFLGIRKGISFLSSILRRS